MVRMPFQMRSLEGHPAKLFKTMSKGVCGESRQGVPMKAFLKESPSCREKGLWR